MIKDFENNHRILKEELDVVEGWYFYSQNHIKRIGDFILQEPSPLSYDKVKNILLTPERFLEHIRIFEV